MISFFRTASIAPGKAGDAIAYAHKIAKYIEEKHGLKIGVLMPVGGNPYRIGWHAMYPGLAEMEAMTAKLMADPEYMALVAGNAPNMLPGSVLDDIWRTI